MTGRIHPPSFTIPPPAPTTPAGSVWPLWALYTFAVLSGLAVVVAKAVVPAVAEAPMLTTAAIVTFGALGAVGAWLLSRINYFRTPAPRTLALAILWGGFAATGYAVLANTAIHDHLVAQGMGDSWSLLAPFTEEPVKDIGIVMVLLLAGTQPRTALDGLVAGSFVGLGFEVIESITRAVSNAVRSYPAGQRDNLGSLTTDVTHELLRNSWTGHIVLTGIAGFGLGYLLTARDRSGVDRWTVAASLAILAFAGHLLWNSHRFGVFYVLGQFGLLALFFWLIRLGRNLESAVYTPYLQYAPELVGPSHIDVMRSSAARRASRKAARASGVSAERTRARQRALADLAAAIANGDAQRAHKSVAALDDEVAAAG